jgi:hypothetical protein
LTPFHCHIAISIAKELDIVRQSTFLIITGKTERSFISPISRIIKSGVKNDSVITFGKWSGGRALFFLIKHRGGCFYSANIKKLYSRLAIKAMNPSKIVTFDDGFGNISGAGYFYTKDVNIFKRAFLAITGLPEYEHLVSKVSKHYSIYPNLDNVYDVTEYISISYCDVKKESQQEPGERYDMVFVGSPLYESDLVKLDIEMEKIEEVVSIFSGRILYLCHPRESEEKLKKLHTYLPSLEIYKHHDIAEIFLLEEKDKIDAIVGFYSSVLFNISSEFPKMVFGKKIEILGGSTIYSKMAESGISILE